MRARRLAMLACAPLGVIAVGLFVPPIVRRDRDHVTSPWEDGWSMAWWVPIAAGVLAVVTGYWVVRRRPPGRASVVVALLAIACAGWLLATMTFHVILEIDDGLAPVMLGLAAILAGTLAFVGLARQRRDWQRWLALLGAYGFVVLPYGCPLLMGMFDLWSGGVTFLAALLVLLVLATRGVIDR